jgi:alpha-beta hydrolase superfamily lysophospholipase
MDVNTSHWVLPNGSTVHFHAQAPHDGREWFAVDAASRAAVGSATYDPTRATPVEHTNARTWDDVGLGWAFAADLARRASACPEPEELDIDGVRTACRHYPAGRGSVLILPGFGQGGRAMHPLAGTLQAAGIASTVVDLPGAGEAARLPAGGKLLPRLARFVAAATDRFDPDLVLGHSLGGRAAIEAPGGREVVAISAALEAGPWLRLLLMPVVSKSLDGVLRHAPSRVRGAVAGASFWLATGRPARHQVREFLRQVRTRDDARDLLRVGRAIAQELGQPRPRMDGNRVTLLYGTRDRFTPPPAGLPPVWIPRRGHFPHDDVVGVLLRLEQLGRLPT